MTSPLCYNICRYFYESMQLFLGERGKFKQMVGKSISFLSALAHYKAHQMACTALPQQNKNLAILHKCMAQRFAGEAYVEALAALLAPSHAET